MPTRMTVLCDTTPLNTTIPYFSYPQGFETTTIPSTASDRLAIRLDAHGTSGNFLAAAGNIMVLTPYNAVWNTHFTALNCSSNWTVFNHP